MHHWNWRMGYFIITFLTACYHVLHQRACLDHATLSPSDPDFISSGATDLLQTLVLAALTINQTQTSQIWFCFIICVWSFDGWTVPENLINPAIISQNEIWMPFILSQVAIPHWFYLQLESPVLKKWAYACGAIGLDERKMGIKTMTQVIPQQKYSGLFFFFLDLVEESTI